MDYTRTFAVPEFRKAMPKLLETQVRQTSGH